MQEVSAVHAKPSNKTSDSTEQKESNSNRKPLKTISNRKKRNRSPTAADKIEPPQKKQKMSKKSSQKKPKQKSRKKSTVNSDANKTHFLHKYTAKTMTIQRILDKERFDDEEEGDTNDKSRNLKFQLRSNMDTNDHWLRLRDIITGVTSAFKYSSKTKPNMKETKEHFIDALAAFLKRKCIALASDAFCTLFNKKYWISEKGFCVLLFIIKDFDQSSINVQHFCVYRFYYRREIFGTKMSGFNVSKPHKIDEIKICPQCCLDDIDRNFINDNPCDCQCVLHSKCTKMGAIEIPKDENKLREWFCPFCIDSGLSVYELKQRRNVFNDSGEYEVEKVIDYDANHNNYIVKWKSYPTQANCTTEVSISFMDFVDEYWKDRAIPLPAQNAIDLEKKENETEIEINIANLEINNKNSSELSDEDSDIEMKSDNISDIGNGKFIVDKLDKIMDKKYIIRRQKYTKETFERFKITQDKYRKYLQMQVKNESPLGLELKRQMRVNKNNVLPKYHLRSVNNDWDCDLPRINDIIINFLKRSWKRWDCDVSHKSFVIAEIIDPENPAKKYGGDQGVHSKKAYGLFAIKKIVKDTLLFEYSGCVKPIREASEHLNHLENELNQTTLFDLIGHLDQKRDKLFWGSAPNDQLVIDPSRWHNEGVYMNDYRDKVMDDPDDDEQRENSESAESDGSKSENQNINQTRKQNVKFYEVLVNNWPRVFAVALEDIEPGQELLGDYGADFWNNFRVMMKRQKQLSEIKARICEEWTEKYGKLEMKCAEQQKEIEKLKKKNEMK